MLNEQLNWIKFWNVPGNVENEIRPLTMHKLHLFLHVCAQFYKELYAHNAQLNLSVALVIPHMRYFSQLMQLAQARPLSNAEKEESIVMVLINEILPQCPSIPVLINQDHAELDSLVTLLNKRVPDKEVRKTILCISTGTKATTIFNPYVLKKDHNYNDYHVSPTITPILLASLKSHIKTENSL